MRTSLGDNEDQGDDVPATYATLGNVPAACPIGRSMQGTHGHSRTARCDSSPAKRQAGPLRKQAFLTAGRRPLTPVPWKSYDHSATDVLRAVQLMATVGDQPAQLAAGWVLTTTRSVRKGLDTTPEVPRELIEDCLRVAMQAAIVRTRRIPTSWW